MTKAKLTYVKDSYYYYVQRENSIQNSSFSDKKFDIFHGVSETLRKIKMDEKFESYRDALVFNQIILLFIYQIIQIPNFKQRRLILKKWNQYAKPYNILKNPYWKEFLKNTGKKTRMYYSLVLSLECHKLFFLENIVISLFQSLKKHFQTITLLNLEENEIRKLAAQNSNLKSDSPSISVVIPNYNYEKFLVERISSILSQKVKISEIIFLDDCSNDSSIQVIDNLEKWISPSIPVIKKYNEKNSGTPFAQWQKGMELATGDYVWICEADDYCHPNMLKELVKPIKKEKDIVISYCDTAMISTDGKVIASSVKKEIDQQHTKHWNHNYIIEGVEEIKNYAYLNCTIANVSSTLIKKGDYQEFFEKSKQYRQAGDWLFYIQIMKLGKVAYNKKAYNYYRIHGNNVTSTTKKQSHLKEIQKIHEEIDKRYGLTEEQRKMIQKRYDYLKRVWNL